MPGSVVGMVYYSFVTTILWSMCHPPYAAYDTLIYNSLYRADSNAITTWAHFSTIRHDTILPSLATWLSVRFPPNSSGDGDVARYVPGLWCRSRCMNTIMVLVYLFSLCHLPIIQRNPTQSALSRRFGYSNRCRDKHSLELYLEPRNSLIRDVIIVSSDSSLSIQNKARNAGLIMAWLTRLTIRRR